MIEKLREKSQTVLLKPSIRVLYLRKLRDSVKNHREEIISALKEDIGKSDYEGFMTEYATVMQELNFFINNTLKLARTKNASFDLLTFPNKTEIRNRAFGVCLIISPWNYPFNLSMIPVIDAIAAGNSVYLMMSRKNPRIRKLMKEVLKPVEDIVHLENDRSYDEVLEEKFDFYFFTGSKNRGQAVYKKAAENLKPCVLELGGKSPCIVDKDVDLEDVAKKICWAKFTNSGQTCVAVDYLVVEESIKDRLLHYILKEIDENYSDISEMSRIKTREKYDEFRKIMMDRTDRIGGKYHDDEMIIEPCVFTDVTFNDEIMKDEIFGPLLPVISYTDIDAMLMHIRRMDNPLAFYVFTKDKKLCDYITNSVGFGGGCINDCMMHISNNKAPFGGFGNSGLGHYHGKWGFDTFSHKQSVYVSRKIDNPFRFKPFTSKKLDLMKKFLG